MHAPKCSHIISTIQQTKLLSSACPFDVDVPEDSAVSLFSLLSYSSLKIAQDMSFPHIWIDVLEHILGSRPVNFFPCLLSLDSQNGQVC